MVLAQAEEVQPDLVGEFNLFEQVRHALHGRWQSARDRVRDQRGKAVDSNLHSVHEMRDPS